MNFLRLRTYDNYIEAHLAKNKLENAGIPCFITNEYTSTMLPTTTYMLQGGIQLMVRKEDWAEAQSLFASDEETGFRCPECGSENIVAGERWKSVKNMLLLIFSLLLAVPLGRARNIHLCRNCRHVFKK
jgi:predicted RNA-binding Zn-ribbon protein involved in translation (DUF1610 family)